MSSFWSAWIIILTSTCILGITWILLANRKTTGDDPDATTGHVYDGIEEYDKPLPAWWLYSFLLTIVFALGYLLLYPGMGSFKGLLGWTQVQQWEEEMAKAEKRYGEVFAKHAATPITELAQDKKTMRMARRMFANNCAQCHGSDAGGAFGFPNLTDKDWLYGGTPEQIKTTITHGRKATMPAWASVIGDQGVLDASAYVVTLGGGEASRGNVEAGKKHFATFCSSCHGAEGKGLYEFGAPDLTDKVWLYGGSQGQIIQTIRNGRSGAMPAHKELLSADKIHMLAAYVFSLSQDEKTE